MQEVNLSAENIRATLTETLGRLRKASADYFELLEKGLASSPLPIRDQIKQFLDLVQRNVTATFDLGDKLIQAKDMQEAAKSSPNFSRSRYGHCLTKPGAQATPP